jgi:hypothetical protein
VLTAVNQFHSQFNQPNGSNYSFYNPAGNHMQASESLVGYHHTPAAGHNSNNYFDNYTSLLEKSANFTATNNRFLTTAATTVPPGTSASSQNTSPSTSTSSSYDSSQNFPGPNDQTAANPQQAQSMLDYNALQSN